MAGCEPVGLSVFAILVFAILVFAILVFAILVFAILVFAILVFAILVFAILVFAILVFAILVFSRNLERVSYSCSDIFVVYRLNTVQTNATCPCGSDLRFKPVSLESGIPDHDHFGCARPADMVRLSSPDF